MREQWPFFRTRIDMLEMVLAKADADIARLYDERLVQPDLLPLGAHATYCRRRRGGAGPDRAVAAAGAQPDTLEFIRLRNTYLDPLHLLQAECWRSRARKRRRTRWSRRCWCPWRDCRRVAQHRLRFLPVLNGADAPSTAEPGGDVMGGCAWHTAPRTRQGAGFSDFWRLVWAGLLCILISLWPFTAWTRFLRLAPEANPSVISIKN
jgi:hypothetical protein